MGSISTQKHARTLFPRSMNFMATSSRVSLLRISLATPKLPAPISRTGSYRSMLLLVRVRKRRRSGRGRQRASWKTMRRKGGDKQGAETTTTTGCAVGGGAAESAGGSRSSAFTIDDASLPAALQAGHSKWR